MITMIYTKTSRGNLYQGCHTVRSLNDHRHWAGVAEYFHQRSLSAALSLYSIEELPYSDLDSPEPLHEPSGPHSARQGWDGWTMARAEWRNGSRAQVEAEELEGRKNTRHEHDYWMDDDGEIKSFNDHKTRYTCWKNKASRQSHQYTSKVCHITD